MTGPSRYRLGVDLGTSTTIAMLHWPDGRIRPLLFDGSPLLRSAVFLGADGRLHTGRDAEHLARGNPERLEPNPKRRIDEAAVLLGTAEVPVRDLLAAVLGRVAAEATRVAGRIGELTLTHPAAWGPRRCNLLVAAAQHAGLGRPRLISEPQAAATYFAGTMSAALPPGANVLVYDLGAGTCDVTLLRREPHGFVPIASDGLNDVGGLDLDAAVVGFLQATYGEVWRDNAGRRQVWEEVRTAKEMLSRTSGTVITLSALGKEVPLGREQFDGLVTPVLQPTITMTQALLRAAPPGDTALVLVGGASRTPVVATLLGSALGIVPIVTEQPELVVAEGCLHTLGAAPVTDQPTTSASGRVPVSGPPGGYGPTAPASGPPGMYGPTTLASGFSPAAPASGPPGVYGPTTPASGFSPTTPASGPPGTYSPTAPASGPPGTYGPTAPASAPPGSSGPSSPASGFSPAASASGPHGAYGSATPAPARSRRGLVIALAAALVVVLGASAAAVAWYSVGRGSGPTGRPGSSAPGGSAPPSTAAGRYPISLVPEDLCSKVDLGPLASTFESVSTPPTHQRNLSTVVSTAFCAHVRQHGTAVSAASISFSIFLYTDTGLAVTAQRQALDNAKLNDTSHELVMINGLGDEAFINRMPTNSATADRDAGYAAEVRDGNLRWTVYLNATQIASTAWSKTERAQLTSQLQAAVKASHAKLTKG